MASSPLEVQHQTDEEFFDKLVDDDDGAEAEDMATILSNPSIRDVEKSGCASEEDGSKDSKSVEFSEASKGDACVKEIQSEALSIAASGGAKGTNVKEVKWGDFSVNSQPFGQVGFESDLFFGSADGSLVIPPTGSEPQSTIIESTTKNLSSYSSSYEQQDAQLCSSVSGQSANLTKMKIRESIYPGWKYDPNAGQWYPDDFIVTRESSGEGGEGKVQNGFDGSVTEGSDSLYCQQTSHSFLETISEESIVSNSWNQVSQVSVQYPPNMVFDPQYPEWYYDTITQQWYTLQSYNNALHNASSAIQYQQSTNVNALAGSPIADRHVSYSSSDEQSEQYSLQEHSSQESHLSASATGFEQQSMLHEQNTQRHWNASGSGSNLQNMWQQLPGQESHQEAFVNGYDRQNLQQPDFFAKNGDFATVSSNHLTGSFYGSMGHAGSQPIKQLGSNNLEHSLDHISRNTSQDYVPSESLYHYNHPRMDQSLVERLSKSNYGMESSINYTEQSFQVANPSYSQSYTPNDGRSSAGRPPHTLVTFGFGGKILLMKNFSSSDTTFVLESQGTAGGVVSMHSLVDVLMVKTDSFNGFAGGGVDYIHSLCQQSFPGPLVGGSAAPKDVNKWMDDRIMSGESLSMGFQSGEVMRLLLSLLKILFQHYGKLRSPYGTDSSLEGSDGPESLVSKLFASANRNEAPFGGFGSSKHCMKNLPSEGQMRSTAIEVQTLLVSRKRKEALQCAQEGQLWGPALVLAAQLGEQFYVDTVKKMAKQLFISGSPLRTLCLLIAGQPADVFSADNSSSGLSGAIDGLHQSSGVLPNSMLDDWKENLAIITSNRTKDDELVIIHLGDCLWKVRGDVTAAHTCYLVSEANFESYSDSARLCLIGADHWKNPRTYTCPDAIQRTEIYEYSRVSGNSQFVMLPFQPYKLVYAYMLAEVGKVSDSLRYCQASAKLLKNSGRSPEIEMWRTLFSSLEERLRTHQQGGYGTNLAPTKLVGKLFTTIDRSIHRMIGAPLPPIPHSSGEGKDNNSLFPNVTSSQSTMAITSLIPSASVEAISDWAGDSSRQVVHNRSISEPDFGRSPKQSSTKNSNSHGQGNKSMPVKPSHFGRFGSQLLQKTIGWVSWSRHDRQAKLGESNKFYYDQNLKRWVEEGAEPPREETSLPPPPTSASFPNGISDYNINNALKSNNNLTTSDEAQETKLSASSEPGFSFPPMPPSQNQFSARSRIGVRSRYVDTFNKSGGSITSSFESPSTPSVKPLAGAKFFVPSASTEDQTNDTARASIHEGTITEEPSTSATEESTSSPAPTLPSSFMQRFPSMDNITSSRSAPGGSGSLARTRAASWSGGYTDISNAKAVAMEHSFVTSGLSSTFAPQNDTSSIRLSSSSSLHPHGGGSDDLHDVEL